MTYYAPNPTLPSGPVVLLACDSSNRYDGVTQDWVNATNAFVALRPFVIPAYTLRDYGWIEIMLSGVHTGDATNASVLRVGMLRNGVDNTTSAGCTQFDGGASIDSLAVSAGVCAAVESPFYSIIRLVPVQSEGLSNPFVHATMTLFTTSNGNAATSGTSTSLSIGPAGTTPFDNTIDNTILLKFRRTGSGTGTFDMRSLTVLHFGPRSF